MILQKLVIRDSKSGLYVMCWTEGNTVFLTDNLDNVEEYGTAEYSISKAKEIMNSKCRFLRDSDNSEVSNVDLRAGMLRISAEFLARL